MNMAVYALTEQGECIADKIRQAAFLEMEGCSCQVFTKKDMKDGLLQIVEQNFVRFDAHVFIMAVGIAVRAIARHIQSKLTDPAVVVIDDKGQYAIALLSGHIGGGNALTHTLARAISAVPIITTATDIHDVFSFDLYAKEQGLCIENPEAIKHVSAHLLQGGCVVIYADAPLSDVPFVFLQKKEDLYVYGYQKDGDMTQIEHTQYVVLISCQNDIQKRDRAKHVLYLRPRNLVVGTGLKKGVDEAYYEHCFLQFLSDNNIARYAVSAIVSAEIKKEEAAVLALAKRYHIPFETIPMSILEKVEGRFSSSTVVKEKVGVGSVSEACACIFKEPSVLLVGKTKYSGVTFAVAKIL